MLQSYGIGMKRVRDRSITGNLFVSLALSWTVSSKPFRMSGASDQLSLTHDDLRLLHMMWTTRKVAAKNGTGL
jgi:hypothetical protein